MRVTVLGCWAPYPAPGGACSGYVIQDAAANTVLDLGHGAFSRLHQIFDFRSVHSVIITHLHPDHYADLHCLRHAVAGALRDGSRRQGPVNLYLPDQPADVAGYFDGCQDAFHTVFIKDLPTEIVPPGVQVHVCQVGPVRFFLLPVQHNLPAYAVGVEGSGYLVYTGDTCPTPELVRFAEKADILLCEASGLNSDERAMAGRHMTAGQAGELARQARVKELILTHFWPEYDLEELRRQAEETYGGKVYLATEGDTYFVL